MYHKIHERFSFIKCIFWTNCFSKRLYSLCSFIVNLLPHSHQVSNRSQSWIEHIFYRSMNITYIFNFDSFCLLKCGCLPQLVPRQMYLSTDTFKTAQKATASAPGGTQPGRCCCAFTSHTCSCSRRCWTVWLDQAHTIPISSCPRQKEAAAVSCLLSENRGLSSRLLDSLQHLRQRHTDLAINACWHHTVPAHTDPLVSTPGMAATTQQTLLHTKAGCD